MLSTYIKTSKFIAAVWIVFLSFVVLFCVIEAARANTAHINYSDTSTYNKIKGELESYGYTVTGTNSGSVTLSDFSGKDLHINVAGNNNCGNNCKTAYETYIGNGGTVLIAGNGDRDGNRTLSIESLVESKLSVGTITIYNGEANYLAHAHGSQYSDTTNYWVTRNVFRMDSGGTALADNSGANLSTWKNWAVYSYGSNGGKLIITLDQAQFNHSGNNNSATWTTRLYTFLEKTLEHEGITITTPQSGITSSQQTEVNTAKNKSQTNNAIYLTQSGDGLDLDIVQDGTDNLITGSDLTNTGSISGTNNEITLTQKNAGNVLGIDVNGNTNDVDIWQDTEQNAVVNITGDSNTLDLEQLHLNNNGEHYSKVTVNGNSNSMTIDQKETGNKILFLDVDGSNNVQVDQKGTGNHFLDINLTDSHTVDVTQDGSGSHNATIHLSGNPSSVTLTQDSSNNQNYYLQQNCSSSSCSATVTQN